jgi:hypothetical protein
MMGGVFSRFDVIADDFSSFGAKAFSFGTIFGSRAMWADFLQEAGDYFIDSVLSQFESEGAAKGSPWQELSDVRMNERALNGLNPAGPMLIGETGTLIDSWKWDWLDRESILIGMFMGNGPEDPAYGKFHTFGTKNMPARPMLIVTEEDVDYIYNLFVEEFDGMSAIFFGA